MGEGCNSVAIAIHELMHALSFVHEHNRNDRDKYVIVKLENILSGAEKSFDKYKDFEIDVLETPFDKQSVMHYSNFAFTNKNPFDGESAMTLISKGPLGANEVLGNSEGLSSLDIQRIDTRYCQGVTAQTKTPTQTPPVTEQQTENPETTTTEDPQVTTNPVTKNPLTENPVTDGVTMEPLTETPEPLTKTAGPTEIPPKTSCPTKRPKEKRWKKKGSWWKRITRKWWQGRGRGGRKRVYQKVSRKGGSRRVIGRHVKNFFKKAIFGK
ncbi:zinc metalloproteinase nas-14-like [Clytia hemisphaerica]|uniref:zinc metalloproteinase nas-14-like n=1 Tax=Clytia hemisphaerica TaxID=252671 RepID=UPI0034D67889